MNYSQVGTKLLKAAILLLLIVTLQSCGNKLVLYPLTDKDIYPGKNNGDFCFSQYYLDQVMKATIEKSK